MDNFLYLKENFENLKKYVNNDQYQILDFILYDFKNAEYKDQDVYLESKLFNKAKNYFIQSKVYDKKNNCFLDDEKLENKILFANLWYTLSISFFQKKGKVVNTEKIFSNKSFSNYFKLMLTVICLKVDNRYATNALYYILRNNDEFLYYLFEQIYFNNKIEIKSDFIGKKYIRHATTIFEEYLDNNCLIDEEYKLLK